MKRIDEIREASINPDIKNERRRLKTFEYFRKFARELPPITYTKLTTEEFKTLIKPVMCDICRRIFNPTEEERQSLKKTLEKFDSEDWTWELIINHKD